MYHIQTEVKCAIKGVIMFGLQNSGKGTKRRRKFSTIYPLAITADLKNVPVFPKVYGIS
jgi:hypothetical protein